MNNKGQTQFSNFIVMIMFLVFASIGGLLAGMIYYDMNTIQNVLLTVNFDIPIENPVNLTTANLTDFQDILGITVYPILGLKTSLIYLSYFMVFAFIIALSITAYVSVKNPVFFVLHLLFTILITYFSIILSNTYKELLENQFINAMMTDFVIYNKLMFYLPQVIFFTSLVFGAISFINLMKPQTNNSVTGLNYGGDY